MIGKTISHYKILSKLGEGGMGVVYKANDTKLDREVALKFLPANQLGTGDDQKRFEQEAKAAAKLSHSNIAHVYEINEHEGQTFIAMEYIYGETLSDIVEKRPLKIKDAIKIAKQIAEGLHTAHEQGIVHRDIKSANIMITHKGVVKIMDFGLAKLSKASMMTKAGTTLGTISYMSPEQTQGEKVDHRSDIWSLGVVLYEIVSGQLPFKGDYESAIIYSIMNEEPEPLTAVRTGVPMDLEKIVNKLLAKEPGERYQNIVELPVDLKNVSVQETTTSKIGSSAITDSISQTKKVSVEVEYSYKTILKALALVVPAVVLTWMLKPGPPPPAPALPHNIVVPLPENTSHSGTWYNTIAISPNGKNIVYVGVEDESRFVGLFFKGERDFTPIKLDGTRRAAAPFFSPDGRWIGYFQNRSNEIYKMPVSGGDPLLLAEGVTNFSNPTWAPDNTIIFEDDQVLKRIPDSGGKPEVLTKKGQGSWHGFPNVLPDGKTVLFTVRLEGGDLGGHRLALYTFGDDDYRIILDEEGYNAVYSRSGHILYGRSERLMAVAFDLENLRIRGVPAPVIDNVATRGWGNMSYAMSAEGTIAYVEGVETDESKSVINVDVSGKETRFTDEKKNYDSARYSPDGKYVAFKVEDRQGIDNIWIYDIGGGALNQLTLYKAVDDLIGLGLAWSPDSESIAYATMAEDSTNSVYIKRRNGAGTPQKVYTSSLEAPMHVKSWSHDGKYLTFDQRNGEFNFDLFVYSFDDSTAKLFFSSPRVDVSPYFSPNGKWIAYMSNESGTAEVYVRPFPESSGGVWKISNDGGEKPVWSPDGQKIYYRSGNEMYSVDVTATDTFSKGNPEKIFEGNYFRPSGRTFDIHPDGDRFIIFQREDVRQSQDIRVIQNFDEKLKQLVPVGGN